MFLQWVLRMALVMCCILCICLAQSGEEELVDTGSGATFEELRDSAQEFKNEVHDPTQCGLTFYTLQPQEPCKGAGVPSASKEDLDYVKELLRDTNSILHSLQYTTSADAGDLSYQETIVETIKVTKQDNRELQGAFIKVLQEFHTQFEDDQPDLSDDKKRLKKDFQMVDHMLRMNRRLAEQLDVTSQDLDVLLSQHFKKSMALSHRATAKS